ncbi:MAG: hypothetical protein M1816_007822 [Peltula sp. TS41687]|nr:MAG: hypothetical protein M1816_007822 [Peltula sp. TS41687]
MFLPAVSIPVTAIEQAKFTRLDDELDELNLDGTYSPLMQTQFIRSRALLLTGHSFESVLAKRWDDYVGKRLESGHERSTFPHWLFSIERLLNLAHPSKVIDRIRTTDYHSVEATMRLGHYFERFGRAARARVCPVPLGYFGKQDYSLYPQCHMPHLLEEKAVVSLRWNNNGEDRDDGDLGLAELAYFCLGRCSVKDGRGRRNPGVWSHLTSVSPSCQRIVFQPADSAGFVSFQTNFSFISNDDGGDDADGSLNQGRKASGASDSSTDSSKASDGSIDSGSSLRLAAIAALLTTHSDQTSSSSASFKRSPSTSTKPRLPHPQPKSLRHPFLYLGDLGRSERRPPAAGQHATVTTDYVLAVSLYDLSVWMIYDAWDYGDDTHCVDSSDDDDEEEEEEEEEQGEVRHSSFRPDVNPFWARVSGVKGSMLMAKIAEDVRSWPFEAAAELRLSQTWIANVVVPVFLRARVSREGRVVHPEGTDSGCARP